MDRILYIAMADIHRQSGGGYANRAFYESLRLHYPDKVDLVQFQEYVEEDDKNSYGVPPKSGKEKIFDLSRGIIHRFTPWLLEFVRNNGHKYGCCVINNGILGDIIPEIKEIIPTIVMIHHNDEATFQKDNNRPTTFWGLTSYFVNRNQKKSYEYADLNVFLTEYDKVFFENKYGGINSQKNVVVGIYETQEQYSPLENRDLPANVLAITGALHNIQTLKGVKDFYSHYLNVLQRYYDNNYKLIIAGRNPGKCIKSLQSNNINVVANPVDMKDVVNKAGIFVCPIHVGSGLKLRIMDGLKMGMPILTHAVSARGYEYFKNERWFQIYDDSESFWEGLKQINDAIKTESNLQRIIYEKYREYFSFEEGDKRFYNAIKKVYG